jgi:lipopolysaccharide transport system ATP-binding protein
MQTIRGEIVFTSFDTDEPKQYDKYATRPAGRYLSRSLLPAHFLNEGQYVLGINASSFRVRRYFQEERALAFTVDAMGAPGMQWPEPRQGLVRPLLEWKIEAIDAVKA